MRRIALAVVALAGVGALPAAAHAVTPGPNGQIVFTSSRDDGATTFADTTAQIWMLPGPTGGTPRRLTTTANGLHHRHPTLSPDRTKVAYARCPGPANCGFSGPWDIFVLDLQNGGPPQNLTSSATSEDRPNWSPDGTRISYGKESAANNWDLKGRPAGGGAEGNVAEDLSVGAGSSGQFARSQWTPDSQTLVYSRIVGASDYDIYSSPADGSNPIGTPLVAGTTNDYQPAVSADGSQICFTREGAGPKNVIARGLTGGTEVKVTDLTNQNYECAWSADGQKIAFVRGAFGNGAMHMRNADGTGETNLTDSPGKFDGNPEQTFNPRPACTPRSVAVPVNGFATVPPTCTDTPDRSAEHTS